MKNELQLLVEDRIKNVLVKDKEETPNKVINILKSEIMNILKNYMEISSPDIDICLNLDKNGHYCLEIYATIKRLKRVSAILLD